MCIRQPVLGAVQPDIPAKLVLLYHSLL